MKSLFLGILVIIIVGIGGLVYRNAIEHPLQTVACPVDAKVCPDGTAVSRVGSSCEFSACLPPNVTLTDLDISYAVPEGFVRTDREGSIVAYTSQAAASSTVSGEIAIKSFMIEASSTALATIQKSAVGDPSGLPVSVTSFTSTVIGNHRFTVVQIGRFEGVIDTAYYLARATDVLRFDAIDSGTDWTNPNLNVATLPAHAALVKMLATLQGQ